MLYTVGPHAERPRRETTLHSALASTSLPHPGYDEASHTNLTDDNLQLIDSLTEMETMKTDSINVPEERMEELSTLPHPSWHHCTPEMGPICEAFSWN